MSDFTDYGENLVAGVIAGTGSAVLPDDLTIALLESAAEDSFVPLAGFSRAVAPRSLQTWTGTQGGGSTTISSGSSRTITNVAPFDFGTAPENATANALGIYAGDNPLAYILMNEPRIINKDDSVTIGAGEVSLSLMNIGGATNYCANKLLDLIFRGQDFTFPAPYYVGLYTTAPDESGGGVECSGAGYARAALQFTEPSAGAVRNSGIIQYATPETDWGTIEAFGLSDNVGNLLFFCAMNEPKTIMQGAGAPRFVDGAISLEVQ